MYEIGFVEEAITEIRRMEGAARARLLDEIEEQLRHEPARETRRRKRLSGLEPPWEHVPPVWQLRVGDWRVFYDVDTAARMVIVRAVRRKGKKLTEEIL